MTIPAYVNAKSGSAKRALDALRGDARFAVHEVDPAQIVERIRAEAARGTPRVLVAGGDGTIAQAAGAVAGTGTALCVLPGGTLNHFARDANIPVDDHAAALELAATGQPRPTDLGYVGDHAILGTSSIGAYVRFVRTRERYERWFGYYLASFLALVRVWLDLRGFRVAFRASDGTERVYRTPILFVGVGERALDRAGLGTRVPGGASALHVFVVRETTRARLAALAFGALSRGLDDLVKTEALDAHLVDACTVTIRRRHARVSIDGEIVTLTTPLEYRLVRGAVNVVVAR